jgi:hypothetical protein
LYFFYLIFIIEFNNNKKSTTFTNTMNQSTIKVKADFSGGLDLVFDNKL